MQMEAWSQVSLARVRLPRSRGIGLRPALLRAGGAVGHCLRAAEGAARAGLGSRLVARMSGAMSHGREETRGLGSGWCSFGFS